jgi:hypothetical protein
LSLNAAAVVSLIENHVISGEDLERANLLGAVASEHSRSVDDHVTAAAANDISLVWLSKSLAVGQRRILNTASAVLCVSAIIGSLVQAGTLRAEIDWKTG